METIELSTTVLDWAARSSGSSLSDVAQKISKKSLGVEKIVSGIMTYAQVKKFSQLTGIRVADLFLDSPPPPRRLPIADFRTVQYAEEINDDFFDVYDDIIFKQSWYHDERKNNGYSELDFVGRFNKTRNVSELASDIRETLRYSLSELESLKKPDDLFSLLSKKSEDIGILVFKNGVVGNNTRRPISVNQFRGFAICDRYAPVIFVNGCDAPAAWVFTLAHELAHIWIGETGISDGAAATQIDVEKFCNSVAGEFLLPSQHFISTWLSLKSENAFIKISEVKKAFKVSEFVVARKAYDLKFIDIDVYEEVYKRLRFIAKQNREASSGGDFYRTLAIRNSKRFTNEVTNLAISGKITLGQAGRLLNTNPNNVVKFYSKQHSLSI